MQGKDASPSKKVQRRRQESFEAVSCVCAGVGMSVRRVLVFNKNVCIIYTVTLKYALYRFQLWSCAWFHLAINLAVPLFDVYSMCVCRIHTNECFIHTYTITHTHTHTVTNTHIHTHMAHTHTSTHTHTHTHTYTHT